MFSHFSFPETKSPRARNLKIMETLQSTQQTRDSVFPPQGVTTPESSLPLSKQNSGEPLSLSPAAASAGSSPTRPPPDSDNIIGNPSSPERMLPLAVVEEPADIQDGTTVEEPKAMVIKTDSSGGSGGGERRRFGLSLSILKSAKREKAVKRAALAFRVLGFLFCLVSISVMAANRNQGWALDSFDRYGEFWYCISANGIAFIYSGAQAIDISYNLATGKYVMHPQRQLRHYFTFAADQIIAYLLMSASSSATVRVDDWQSNWGKDRFTAMATASISMSYLGFVALAFSSLVSGYVLCTSNPLQRQLPP